jgi:hypothetical protein
VVLLTVPTCKSCGQHANVLTIDPCPNCNAKNWDEKTVLKPVPKSGTNAGPGGGGCIVGLIILVLVGFGVYNYFDTPDSEALSSQYGIPKERAYVQSKPHGCAYNDAPLGDKHCHYEKHIIVYSQDGRVVEKDGSHATECPSCQVWSVELTWQKIQE